MVYGTVCERRSGLVVSALDSISRGLGSSPLTVPFSTHEYKWVPANCQGKPVEMLGEGGGGVTRDFLASYPGRVAILLVA